jgi:hypothetical protein
MKTDRKELFRRVLASAVAALAILLTTVAFAADSDKDKSAAPGSGADPQSTSAASTDTNAASTPLEPHTHHNPFLAKMGPQPAATGGVDPHGDSWQSIKNSFQQFAHPEFMLRLLLSLALSVACAWVIAWHPRSLRRGDPISALEERKAFIILGVVGAIVAELSGTSPTLAFVIFGIGALLRFRTVLDNPKATGKAILVVVIGLACGMGSWTMAVFVTAFSWALIYWLDSHLTCNLTVRLEGNADSKPLQLAVESLLLSHRCRLQSSTLSKSKKRLAFLFHMPAGLDEEMLEAEVKAKLPKNGESRVTIEVI